MSYRRARDEGCFMCTIAMGLVDEMNQSLLASAEYFLGISVAGGCQRPILRETWMVGHLGYVAKLCISARGALLVINEAHAEPDSSCAV